MTDDAPNRFDRIIAILIQLQSKKVVRAQEMADRFGVSLRTIYRDIRTLEAAGVPIYSEAGIGYSIVEGYRLPPVMFTREEATGFIAAEKLMQQFSDKALGSHFASALFKIKSVLRADEKEHIERIESKVIVKNLEASVKNAPTALSDVFAGIGEKKQLEIIYESLSGETPQKRHIEPVGIFHENKNWYIFAYCHLRNDYRQFRSDRIHKIQKTNLDFSRKHASLEEQLALSASKHITEKAVIAVDPSVVKFLKSDRNGYGFVSERNIGNEIEMTFESRDLHDGLARWYLMFADFARIIEPESFKIRVLELLERGKNNL